MSQTPGSGGDAKHRVDGPDTVAEGRAGLPSPSPSSPRCLPQPSLQHGPSRSDGSAQPCTCDPSVPAPRYGSSAASPEHSRGAVRSACPPAMCGRSGFAPPAEKAKPLPREGMKQAEHRSTPNTRQIASSEDVPFFKMRRAPQNQTGCFSVSIYHRPFFTRYHELILLQHLKKAWKCITTPCFGCAQGIFFSPLQYAAKTVLRKA